MGRRFLLLLLLLAGAAGVMVVAGRDDGRPEGAPPTTSEATTTPPALTTTTTTTATAAPEPSFRSTIADGGTVPTQVRWEVSVQPGAEAVELWVDGERVAAAEAASAGAFLSLTPGAHRLGIAYTAEGRRSAFGKGGVALTVTARPAAADAAGPTVDVWRHTLRPGSENDAGHIASWTAWSSGSTEEYPTDRSGTQTRTIRWEPGGRYERDRTTFVRCAWRFVEGSPARLLNFHNHPADYPGGWEQATVGGSSTSGVSPVAIDWKEDAVQGDGHRGLMVVTQPNELGGGSGGRIHWPILSDEEMRLLRRAGAWLVLELRIRWALASDPAPGAVTVWRYVNGERETEPVVDVDGINTRWLEQDMVALWEGGGYWNAGFRGQAVTENAGCQVGRDRDELLADRPTRRAGWESGVRERAGTFAYP